MTIYVILQVFKCNEKIKTFSIFSCKFYTKFFFINLNNLYSKFNVGCAIHHPSFILLLIYLELDFFLFGLLIAVFFNLFHHFIWRVNSHELCIHSCDLFILLNFLFKNNLFCHLIFLDFLLSVKVSSSVSVFVCSTSLSYLLFLSALFMYQCLLSFF